MIVRRKDECVKTRIQVFYHRPNNINTSQNPVTRIKIKSLRLTILHTKFPSSEYQVDMFKQECI